MRPQLSAVPKPDPRIRTARMVLSGEIAVPDIPPSGCYFHPRCRYAKEICSVERPALRKVADEHCSACHFAEELRLTGVFGPAAPAEAPSGNGAGGGVSAGNGSSTPG